MSLGARARLLATILVGLSLWPIVHRVLVIRYDVNPWKLLGFAMYCTPHKVEVNVLDTSHVPARLLDERKLSAPTLRAMLKFGERRGALGKLISPRGVASLIFRDVPEAKSLRIRIGTTELNPTSSKLETRWVWHEYQRSAR